MKRTKILLVSIAAIMFFSLAIHAQSGVSVEKVVNNDDWTTIFCFNDLRVDLTTSGIVRTFPDGLIKITKKRIGSFNYDGISWKYSETVVAEISVDESDKKNIIKATLRGSDGTILRRSTRLIIKDGIVLQFHTEDFCD